MWVAHDCGKALNRLTVEGQVQGSVWMGMGQAMSEEAAYHDGLMLTANMLDYRVPTIQDSPPIEVGIVESMDPHGPFGAKEAGEGSLAAFLPALTNAIADAIGIRFNDLPVTPDRVFEAIEKRKRALEKKAGGLMDALPEFRVLNPTTLAEVIAARAAHPGSMPLGGGTDLVVNIRRGIVAPPVLIDMNRVAELHAIKADEKTLEIGASVRAERAGRASGASIDALSGGGAGGGAHRRPDPAQHGHGRRQSLPRHPLHLLQSERMVARRQ